MSKIVISDITDTPGSVIPAINAKFQQIEDELNDKVLYRDNPGTEDNALSSDVDYNGNNLLNANTIETASLVLNGVPAVPSELVSGTANSQVVNSLADLHFDVAQDAYVLKEGWLYLVAASTIDFGTAKIVVEDHVVLRGLHRTKSVFKYSGTSTFITTTGSFYIEFMGIEGVGTGKLLDAVASYSTATLVLQNGYYRNFETLGDITGYFVASARLLTAASFTNGFCLHANTQQFNETSGLYFNYTGTVFDFQSTDFTSIQFTGNTRFAGNVGSKCIKALPSSANFVVGGRGTVTSTSFGGEGTLEAFSPNDASWTFKANSGVSDSHTGCESYANVEIDTQNPGIGVTAPVASLFTVGSCSRFMETFEADGSTSFEYVGVDEVELEVTASLQVEKGGGTNSTYGFTWERSSIAVPAWTALSPVLWQIQLDNKIRGVHFSSRVIAVPGDSFRLGAANLTSGTQTEDLKTHGGHVLIKGT